MDGKNIADYIDADILKKLEELELEEEMLDEARKDLIEDEEEEVDPELMASYKEVKKKKALIKQEHKLKVSKRAYPKNKSLTEMKEKLQDKGYSTEKIEDRVKNNKRKGVRLSQLRQEADGMEIEEASDSNEMMDEDEEQEKSLARNLKKRKSSISRSRSKGFKIEKSEMAKVFFFYNIFLSL